jgi:cell division septum initiation protein DivIVA
VSDRMNRVKGLLAGATPTSGITGPSIGSNLPGPPIPPDRNERVERGERGDRGDHEKPSEAGTPHHALQVLTLAQRTADEHLAAARADAEKIRAEARAAAEAIAREAAEHAEGVRTDANKMLADARDAAAQTGREAAARTSEAQAQADKMVSEAQARAEAIAADAQAGAEELKMQAEQRYQDVVGSLATKREALQQQIESLENFDREYRSRLTSFMQHQLRALWVDQPQVDADAADLPGGDLTAPAQRNGADPATTRP